MYVNLLPHDRIWASLVNNFTWVLCGVFPVARVIRNLELFCGDSLRLMTLAFSSP